MAVPSKRVQSAPRTVPEGESGTAARLEAPRRPADKAEVSSHTNLLARCLAPDGTWAGLLAAATALSHLVEGEMDRALAIVGLTATGFAAILEIARAEVASQGELARRLGISGGATSELLGRLRRRGLVSLRAAGSAKRRRRVRPSGSKRARSRGGRPPNAVSLTPAGRALLAVAARIAQRVEGDWAARLAAEDGRAGVRPTRVWGLRRWLTECATDLRRPRDRGA